MKRLLVMVIVTLFLTACNSTEVEREIGYKGKARVNPWLAAERFVGRMGWQVRSVISWTAPTGMESVWILPASILNNESFTRRFEEWVEAGGHLILLVEHADEETNDWSEGRPPLVINPALFSMLKRADVALSPPQPSQVDVSAREIVFAGTTYQVDAQSRSRVATGGGKPGVFASVELGEGRLTVLTDARLLRNRWIADLDHATLLHALVGAMRYQGNVGFMRGSGISLWALVQESLGPVLLGGALWLLLWLWKNLKRFGPLDTASPPSLLRGYTHHLQALGDFQWRLDRAASLLADLRQQIGELGQRAYGRTGIRDGDFHQFLADQSGVPRERVSRALSEVVPGDSSLLTRTIADLQQLIQILHPPTQP